MRSDISSEKVTLAAEGEEKNKGKRDQSDQMQWRTTRDRLGELAFPVSLSSTCLLSEAHKSREPSPCPAHSLLSLQCPAESLACPGLEINMF